jgi:hypothetical protein
MARRSSVTAWCLRIQLLVIVGFQVTETVAETDVVPKSAPLRSCRKGIYIRLLVGLSTQQDMVNDAE